MPTAPWKIHKFGGSSLFDADCFRRVATIVRADPAERVGVVVSAMGGMTDRLLRLAVLAEHGDQAFVAELDEIGHRLRLAADELLTPPRQTAFLEHWKRDAAELRDILASISDARSAPPPLRDRVSGYGELWSAELLAAYLAEVAGEGRGGAWIDARDVIVVHHGELGPAVNWPRSQRGFDERLAGLKSGIVVFTGYIASDEDGRQTTLGRNGSDFSASIVAALAGADQLTIWTDVDGVMSGDPKRVSEARVIDALSYNEALELAYFGATVIHPQTLGPAIDNGIPVLIRNTFGPDNPGTRIGPGGDIGAGVKGITAIEGMALVNLEGTGMIGVPGTADRLFAALKRAGISVTLISQASSEHSICIAVRQENAARAAAVIGEAFSGELADGQIQKVDLTERQTIIAVVGDRMAGCPGIAARFFGSLGRAGINVRAIAQGSSERNISAVVDAEETTRALGAAHSGFYLSAKTVSIGLIGPGVVGSELLDQLARRAPALHDDLNLDLRLRGIARSGRMLLGERRIALDGWREQLDAARSPFDADRFVDHVDADHLPHTVIIDCTSSDDIAGRYVEWLRRGIHVVTPNKKAISGELDYYESLREAASAGSAHFMYETTVGAALPIVSTLRDLLHTGDTVRSITGILSGTLAYLFNVYDGSRPFSDIVREAKASGYTEPDPRDDLSGMDVARKLTILARELGMSLSIGDFPVQNLVPAELVALSIDEFLAELPRIDEAIDAQYRKAQSEGRVLRYVATLDDAGRAAVGLQSIPGDHALAHINLTDNIVQFVTDRYSDNPLVVQGPGAGPAVTAGGVFSDLLRLAAYLQGGD